MTSARGRFHGLGRGGLVRAIVFLVSAGAVIALWHFWRNPNLERPVSNFAGSIQVGIGPAPADTRVFFEFHPWQPGTTATIVLGQSASKAAPPTRFQIEFRGFLAQIASASCQHRSAHLCWTGDATVTETSAAITTTLSGSFAPGGFTRIDLSPVSLGAAIRGPYRSIYQQITATTAGNLTYPARGVEVEIESGIGSTRSRYDGFFPAQPYRLYPDGWAWLLPAPGGPIGAQITDVEQEASVQGRSEYLGLVVGLLLALVIQVAYELITRYFAPERHPQPPVPA